MPRVGEVVKLLRPCLGNEHGSYGICYEVYKRGQLGDFGASYIFENGNLDGFAPEEREQYLEIVGFIPELENYQFISVIRVNEDFKGGVFKVDFTKYLTPK